METSLTPEQLKDMETRIREETERLESKYPKADRLDVVVICLLELWEKLFDREKRLIEKDAAVRDAIVRLPKLTAAINRKISELTE